MIHIHILYMLEAGEQEFLDKINGLSYEEIAKRGGGILNSADRLHATSEDELYEQAMIRVNEIIAKGTGCVEIKSGYGLNVGDELKMLRGDSAHKGIITDYRPFHISWCACCRKGICWPSIRICRHVV